MKRHRYVEAALALVVGLAFAVTVGATVVPDPLIGAGAAARAP